MCLRRESAFTRLLARSNRLRIVQFIRQNGRMGVAKGDAHSSRTPRICAVQGVTLSQTGSCANELVSNDLDAILK